ncbi:MAG: apolipoprotein N-acyltransferase [Candidatus Melainabacteria bacterium]|nr:MAG: apolipoprotein N-acyltransferase [Candidatus Melainabacteria bacterium]
MGPSAFIENKLVATSARNRNIFSTVGQHFASVFFGALLGLSAPGIGLWFYAWVGLIPLLILVASAKRKREAALKALLFGLAYNCVYLNWYLYLAPLDWLGFSDLESNLLAGAALFIVSFHQGLIFALFALIFRLLPLKSTMIGHWRSGQLSLPALWTIPLIWVVLVNKLGNAHCLTGVPWSMLEYSQYKQLPLIQVASIIGGIGIEYLIVLVNVILSIGFVTLSKTVKAKTFSVTGKGALALQGLTTLVVLLAVLTYGFWRLNEKQVVATITLSVVQPNVNIEMQKSEHRYTVLDLVNQQVALTKECPQGICIWPESAVPTRLSKNPSMQDRLGKLAKTRNLDLVVGSIDEDSNGQVYNAVFAIRSDGTFLPQAYRKQYLVPFGEYTPVLVNYMPAWIKRLTNTPAGAGYASGLRASVLELCRARVSPLICFETISPELASAGARAGGELLVNVSDLAWFHKSIIGEQMLACAVFRAVENHRFFVFAANTGPSAIISPSGTIRSELSQGLKMALSGKVALFSKLTPFTRWFIF